MKYIRVILNHNELEAKTWPVDGCLHWEFCGRQHQQPFFALYIGDNRICFVYGKDQTERANSDIMEWLNKPDSLLYKIYVEQPA